ncbi:phosphotransferase family protein [Streptomyces sp. NBC_00564]|uniref:phosphotransferase family protein n=1 Tax=Streptomyces sp. NBC_00564 TaxID=2903663 RepID=UPI00352C94A2|nr:phosphotransferase [Streptomyces sp. NBC_00564]
MTAWSDVTAAETERACGEGRLITAGPLNNTYAVTLRGRPVFVRHRVVRDVEYGQTFAAERFVYGLLGPSVNVPRLLFLCEDDGKSAYAGFEFLVEEPTNWRAPGALTFLAEALAAVHGVTAQELGNVGGPDGGTAIVPYLRGLFESELDRAPRDLTREVGHDRLRCWIGETAALFDGEPVTLCHGDVRDANIVTDRVGQNWLVDWEAARFRVAAADFNQLHYGWLAASQEESVHERYVELTGRDSGLLAEQIRSLRILWHLRTMNFYLLVHHQSFAEQHRHVRFIDELLSC